MLERLMRIGYFLSSEEFGAQELVRQAVLAERAGFHGVWISDHDHDGHDRRPACALGRDLVAGGLRAQAGVAGAHLTAGEASFVGHDRGLPTGASRCAAPSAR